MTRNDQAACTKPRSHLTADEAARIVKLRREGLTIDLICQRTGRSRPAVRRALRAAGIGRYRATAPSHKRSLRCNRIVQLARQGVSREEVAVTLKITLHVLKNTVMRQMLKDRDEPLMGAEELAALLGVSNPAIMKAVHAGQLEHGWWFTRHVFTPAQVQAAQEHYAQHVDAADAGHWLTASQVARELGLTPDALAYRLRKEGLEALGLRRVRVIGTAGRVFRYDPQSVLKALQQGRAA